MQYQAGPREPRLPGAVRDDAGAAPVIAITPFATGNEVDRWALLDECYREYMARCALEELFAAGEMWPFEY